jgi:hypothetical protein
MDVSMAQVGCGVRQARAFFVHSGSYPHERVVREQCVFAVRDEVIFAGLHGFRLRPLQVVIGTRCAIV